MTEIIINKFDTLNNGNNINHADDELLRKFTKNVNNKLSSANIKDSDKKNLNQFFTNLSKDLKQDKTGNNAFNQHEMQSFQRSLDTVIAKSNASGKMVDLEDVKQLAVARAYRGKLGNSVLSAYVQRLRDNAASRDDVQNKLVEFTTELKIFGVVQSQIQQHISDTTGFYPDSRNFVPKDFGYNTVAEFDRSPELKKLQEIVGTSSNVINFGQFLEGKNIQYEANYDHDTFWEDEWDTRMAALGSALTEKSKLISDDVNITTTQLNKITNTFNATAEGMTKFVQKYFEVMQQILRSLV